MADSDVIIIPEGRNIEREQTRQFWSDLSWRTIHCILLQDGSMSISDIAQATNASIAETVAAIEAMESLGIISKHENGYRCHEEYLKRPAPVSAIEKEKVRRDSAIAAQQVINHLLENPNAEGAMSKRILYNSNRETVTEYLQALDKITQEFRQKSDAVKPDGVYAISIALTPTTNKDCYK